MAEYYSLLASDKLTRGILSHTKSSKLSVAFRLRSNFKLIVSLRGKKLEITFILKIFLETPIKTAVAIDLVDFMPWN